MILLAIGDVVAEAGMRLLSERLPAYQKHIGADFTVVNGENTAGVGMLPAHAERLYRAGADVITLGNHAFRRHELLSYIEEDTRLLRPANMTSKNPGSGYGVFDTRNGRRILVVSLMGRTKMDLHLDNPFFLADRILSGVPRESYDASIVDIHAELTSEKAALGWYLDGRVSGVFGTHTHVQTADARVLPQGTGFITDIGMTGPVDSVIGMRPDQSIGLFTGAPGGRYAAAEGRALLMGAVFDLDDQTGTCRSCSSFQLE